jgi:hypothetical protein
MKISKEERKKIEKDVLKYVKTFQERDASGNVIDDGLEVSHIQLLQLYKQPFFLALQTDEERLHAKQYFKEQLPFKAWLEEKQRDPEGMLPDIEDFQELYDRNYKRLTKRRT